MLKHELVDEERWISPRRFNRVYAVYQALPGPEAHELCVYFGTVARGRIGGLLAGLGFMLPGFVLMFLLSWVYVRFGIEQPAVAAAFAGIQAAVLALVVRAVHRIGAHALSGRLLWCLAIGAVVTTLLGVHFLVTLLLAGVAHEVLATRTWARIAAVSVAFLVVVALAASQAGPADDALPGGHAASSPGLLALFGSGLRSGLLTFGGAYTVIPFLMRDAVEVGGWMTREQFLDGVALGGVLPAPLIIFSTFVGYIGRGALGALAMTAGIFLPAFGFTLIGHEFFERATNREGLHRFLAGVTAGVVGIIAATTLGLVPTCLPGARSVALFAAGLLVLYLWTSKLATPVIVLLAGAVGTVLFRA